MSFEQDEYLDDEEVIAIPGSVPRYFRAQACSRDGFVFEEFDCAPIFSYGKSTVHQRKKLCAERADDNDQVSHTSFEVPFLYEGWADRDDLIGMCEAELSATRCSAYSDFSLFLHTIFVAPRYRGMGVGRELCRLVAEKEFERIVNVILELPHMHKTRFRLIVDADVRNEAGVSAAKNLFMFLAEYAEWFSLSQGIEIECEEAFDDWVL
ncbi:GNAT family N-acetyltransferase [Pseudomonas aeruginosa]|nr:GNAT family N-acetyltransferase [Pseudomonas aeruginosa]